MEAATRAATRGSDSQPVVAEARPADGSRLTWLVAWLAFLVFLPMQHGHFKGTDELAMFEMTRSLFERGDLAVPPIRHTEIGREGRRYSYFMPGQAFLALPLYALAKSLDGVLPGPATTALAGAPNRNGIHVFGGNLESTLVGLLAPITAAALVALFFCFQRELGVSLRTSVTLALMLAITTHTAVMSTYLLRHTTETLILLGSLMLFGRFARGAPISTLVAGSALASSTMLVRVPATISAPVLGLYLIYAFRERGGFARGGAKQARLFASVLVPLALAVCCYALINHAKWGMWISSPMLDQQGRFGSPLWRGAAGLLLSPGSSVLVYSPLLVLAPAGLIALWRVRRADALALLGLAVTLIVFYARFDGWSGLWSAPGPRYLYPLVPLLLLPVGLWLDGLPNIGARRRAWILAAGLGVTGAWVQLVSILVRWGSVPTLAGYPVLGPDQSGFLFELDRSPVVVMSTLLVRGGPFDSWLLSLWNGWSGVPGRPGVVIALLTAWTVAVLLSSWLLLRALHRAEAHADGVA